MLRKIRIGIALVFFCGITLLFLDFTGTLHAFLGWMAKVQFMPALLAFQGIVLGALVLLTLLFGRVYCSFICPLGIFQDIISRVAAWRKRNRFRYLKARNGLLYSMLLLYVAFLLSGFSVGVSLFDPYSSYGRIASNLFAPLYQWGNNLLAYFAERADSYAFYHHEVWLKSLSVFLVAVVSFLVVAVLAWRRGRLYCNTLCPVGSFLGLLSRFSLFRPVVDARKCSQCGLCAKNCKSSCIDVKERKIDYSRCVACMDCLDVCKKGAVRYVFVSKRESFANPLPGEDAASVPQGGKRSQVSSKPDSASLQPVPEVVAGLAGLSWDPIAKRVSVQVAPDPMADRGGIPPESTVALTATQAAPEPLQEKALASRRQFIRLSASVLLSTAVAQAQRKVDGGLAEIIDKEIPDRETPITPPGSLSARNMARHCTACQLCVSVCPNQVLHPSRRMETLMQPEMSYERGYCRPECTRCSEVCPTGAIRLLDRAEKSATQIGHAVWLRENCVVLTDGVNCGNCARHCPTGAITMILSEDGIWDSPEIPMVDTERCIGCGACENLCPARPYSAIYVEGHPVHRKV